MTTQAGMGNAPPGTARAIMAEIDHQLAGRRCQRKRNYGPNPDAPCDGQISAVLRVVFSGFGPPRTEGCLCIQIECENGDHVYKRPRDVGVQSVADITEYEPHDAAALFPMIEGDAFDQLVADIKANGLNQAIVVDPVARIVDGRNRLAACRAAGINPTFRILGKNEDVIRFVISANINRRHLTDSQRASIGSQLATLRDGQTKAAAAATSIDGPAPVTQVEVAKMFKVSVASLQRACEVRDHGVPELFAAVECGDVAVSAAAAVARLPIQEQQKTVAAGPKAIKAKAKEIRDAKKPQPKPESTSPTPTSGESRTIAEIEQWAAKSKSIADLQRVAANLRSALGGVEARIRTLGGRSPLDGEVVS